MSKKAIPFISFGLIVLPLVLTGCVIEDSERCGNDDGFEYNPDNGKCEAVVDTGTQGSTDTGDTGTVDTEADAGPDTSSETETGSTDDYPTGMGEACQSDADCVQFDAKSCIVPHGEEWGTCTFTNCATSPDSCPKGWRCCRFPEQLGVPPFCLIEEKYPLQGMCQQ